VHTSGEWRPLSRENAPVCQGLFSAFTLCALMYLACERVPAAR
jgi:hypothetical protein